MYSDSQSRPQDRRPVIGEGFQLLFESSAEAVLGASVNTGRVLYANRTAGELFGCEPARLVGHHQTELHPPDESDQTFKSFAKFVARGKNDPAVSVHEILRCDGTRVPVEISYGGYLEAEGENVVFGIFRDLTEVHRTKAELQETRDALARIVDELPGAIFNVYVAPDGTRGCRRVSSGVEAITGLSRETIEATLDEFHRLILPEDREEYERRWVESRRTVAPFEFSFRIRHAANPDDIRWIKAKSAAKTESGGTILWNGFLLDITEQRRLEKANREAVEMRSRFFTTMSHEMRSPLNAIVGMSQLLLESAVDTEQREQTQVLTASSHHLLHLINDVMDFSKLEAGKLKIEPTPFDLITLLEETVDMLTLKAQSRNNELLLQISPRVPRHVVSDAGRLRQVLINLLSNATKFTEDGWITLSVTIDGQDPENKTLHFAVRDTGSGIDKDWIPRLFLPFEQGPRGNARGTGLGLYISKSLVDAMGGTITVESSLGDGSVFSFSHPVRVLSRSWPALLKDDILRECKKRVLVLDDSWERRTTVREWVRAWSCLFEEPGEVPNVLDGPHDSFPDLILVDGELLKATPVEDPLWAFLSTAAAGSTRIAVCTRIDQAIPPEITERINNLVRVTKPLKPTTLARLLQDGDLHDERAESPRAPALTVSARVLVVDDDRSNQIVVQALLREAGYKAEVAGSGKEALRLLNDRLYDLALMDSQLPDISGLETTLRIRSGEAGTSNSRIPIIALTGSTEENAQRQALAAGMDEYLAKPVEKGALVERVSHWVRITQEPPKEQHREHTHITTEILDYERLLDQLDRDKSLAREVLTFMQENLPAHIRQCRKALRDSSVDKLHRIAHVIVSSTATIGARPVADLARQIERSTLHGPADFHSLSLQVRALEDASSRLLEEIEVVLSR